MLGWKLNIQFCEILYTSFGTSAAENFFYGQTYREIETYRGRLLLKVIKTYYCHSKVCKTKAKKQKKNMEISGKILRFFFWV